VSLTFHEDAHIYELDGAVVPSVTQILTRSGLIDFSKIPSFIREAALERGRKVHQAIHYYNERDLDLDAFTRDFPLYAPYLFAWVHFCEQRRFVPVLNELRIASRRHRCAGTLDALGVLDGSAVLLDFKTGRPSDVASDLQTAAYLGFALEWAGDGEHEPLRQFFAKHPVVRRYAVQLRRDETFRVEPYAQPSDFRDFLALVTAQQIVAARRGEAFEVAA
jgi:ATP-dependent exoDNAse (exonuclease V) beta subunit